MFKQKEAGRSWDLKWKLKRVFVIINQCFHEKQNHELFGWKDCSRKTWLLLNFNNLNVKKGRKKRLPNLPLLAMKLNFEPLQRLISFKGMCKGCKINIKDAKALF